ncbi:MAG: helix-turn-helix domain-containing protein [Anaerococcus obesiensis]
MKINSLKIKILMLEQGYNIGTLAEKMNSSRQWLGTVLERGHATMSYVVKLAKALDC